MARTILVSAKDTRNRLLTAYSEDEQTITIEYWRDDDCDPESMEIPSELFNLFCRQLN